MLKYTKVFNGKTYNLISRPGTKGIAKRDAKNIRRGGNFARVTGSRKAGYCVWRRFRKRR